MMKLNKTYLLLMSAFLGAILNSCKDDYLEFEPVAAENSAAFYINMNQAEQAVAAAYSTLSTRTSWDRDILLALCDVASDDAEAGGNFENEVPDIEVFNRFTHLTTNQHIEDAYGVMYRGINFCNIALEKIPGVLDKDPEAGSAIIARRLAEMKFIRALNFFYLTSIFGEIPLVDHVLGPSEYYMDKASFSDLYDLIESDLLDAINVLPEKSGLSSSDVGRATKGAAKALLARLYLFESSFARYYPGDSRFDGLSEKWQDVLTLCEDIISTGEYSLMGASGETFSTWRGAQTNGYQFLFTLSGENCAESIFEIQYINDGLDYTTSRAGSLIQWTGARYYTDTAGLQSGTSYWGLGWPTQSLVDEYDPNDIRLAANVNMLGDSIQITKGVNHPTNFDNTGTGYYMKKYELSAAQFKDAPGHAWQKSPGNIYLLRYADVVLMAAEAAIMTSDNGKALQYINMIRSRARICGNGSVPADLTGTVTLEQLISERRMELAFEGRRFHDLVRWNLAKEKLNNYTTPGGYTVIFESPKHDFMPLPQREITTSYGGLSQHEGW